MDKKNQKLKLLDIGIPIFNEERHLLETLKNLANFKNENIRFLISNNSSYDKTSLICKKIIKKDKRFKYYYHKKKISSFQNFNYIFKKSRAKYFIWNSGHDLRSKNFFKDCIDLMETDKEIALCYSNMRVNNKKNYKLINIQNELKSNDFLNILNFFYNLEYNFQTYGMFRSSLLKKTNLFRNFIGGDVLLIKEMAFLGKIYKLKTKSFTSLRIDSYGDWANYVQKHLGRSKKINFFKDFFSCQLIGQLKILHKYEKNFYKRLIYLFLFFFKLSKNLSYIYFEKIKKFYV